LEADLGYGWARTRPAAVARDLLQPLVIPLLKTLYSVEVVGLEHLAALQDGSILIANHHHHLDAALIVADLPRRVRRRLLVVAAADTIFASPLRGALAALLGNAVPLERDGAIRHDLAQLVDALAHGWSLLIFPEGRLTVGGPLRPFKGGGALLAMVSRAPLVPMWLEVVSPGLWEGRAQRGRMRLSVGRPFVLERHHGHADAVTRLEEDRRIPEHADAGRGAGRDQVTRLEGEVAADERDELGNAEDQIGGRAVLHQDRL
jgi:1-acyl-sn-glycerol-3-phosphate acyltransferase